MQVFKNPNDILNPTLDQLHELKLMGAFFRETLRLEHTVPYNVEVLVTRDFKFGGVDIAPDTLLSVAINGLGYHPDYFDRPLEFRPERWVNEEAKRIHPFCDLAFSGGPRNCIGQHISKIEAKIMLLQLIQNYDVALSDPNQQRKMILRLLIEPEDPMKIKIMRRKA
jgi:cytochrome P450